MQGGRRKVRNKINLSLSLLLKGSLSAAPYDAIHVGAAAPTLPEALVSQLASPGRMFIPVGEDAQSVWQVDKDEHGNVTKKVLFGVMVSIGVFYAADSYSHVFNSMCL